MESLLTLDCLPRLMDAALSPPPEIQMMRSWRAMLGPARLQAEEWLGYSRECRIFAATSSRKRSAPLDSHTVKKK